METIVFAGIACPGLDPGARSYKTTISVGARHARENLIAGMDRSNRTTIFVGAHLARENSIADMARSYGTMITVGARLARDMLFERDRIYLY